METLAVIPARGASKGIPRKNVLPILGRPLIAHTIMAARASQRITRVVVSTDDDEIARTARDWGAEVVMRPPELASDTARSEDALLHVLEHLSRSEGYSPELLVFLQCTSPLTTAADIDGTVDALIAEGADSALAAIPFHYFLWRETAQGHADGINHDKSFRLMRQQRDPEFLETGSVYAMKVDGFLASRFRFFGRTVLCEIPVEHWQEIDEPGDVEIASERMARLGRGNRAVLPAKVRALILDFDGVLTDDRVFVATDGTETVACSRSDGMGIEMLRGAGLAMTVLSKEQNAVVAARCRKLRIECTHGVEDKLPLMRAWLEAKGIPLSEAIYVGNDVNDLACMAAVGLAVAPADGHARARAAAGLVLERAGGRGAIRELAEMLIAAGCIVPPGREDAAE